MVFELTDGEIRAFWFSVPSFRKKMNNCTAVKFDRISIPTGIIEQSNVRDENALIKILFNYKEHNPSKSPKTYLAIPLQQGFIRTYTLPWIPKRDRKSAMSLLVDEEIPIARSDLLYDFLVISEEKQISLQVLLGATRQSLLERYVFVFGQAGFEVTGVDFAFSVVGQALGFEPSEDILYLQGESDSFHMALFRGAVPEIVRTMPAFPTTKESVGSITGRIEAWGNEIRRFLLYYRTQQTALNLKRLVWSGDSVADQLAQELFASNHVSSIEQAQLQDVPCAWQEILDKDTGWTVVAAGYGLRISARRPELNLWRQSNEVQTVRGRYQSIALIACAVWMFGTMFWAVLYLMMMPLRQEVQQLSNQGARIVAQAKHLKDLENAWQKVKGYPEKIGVGLIEVQAMRSAELTIEHVSYKQGSLSLSGSAKNPKSVQALIRTMRELGWEQPALSRYKLTTLNNVEFSVSAKRGVVRTESESMIKSSSEETTQNASENTSISLE